MSHPLHFPDLMNLEKIACWNIRTLASHMDFDSRKTAQLNNELGRLNIDVVALSETHLLGAGNIKEKDYTIFWNGRLDTQREGVGFAIRNTLLPFCSTPVAFSPRLMSLKINTRKGWVNLFSVYAPTLDADIDLKDEFYSQLETEISNVPEQEYLLILGDFNARVGADHERWPMCLGREGVGKMNENGQRVLEMWPV